MGADLDWASRIEAAVGPAPDTFAPAEALVAGQRRMRHRRLSVWTSVASVLVVGSVGGILVRGLDTRPDERPPDRAISAPAFVDSPAPPTPQESLLRYDLSDGSLIVRAGVTIERRLDDVIVGGLYTDSVAAIVEFEGRRWWAFAFVSAGRSGSSDQHLAVEGRTFEQWTREKALLETGGDWVRLDASGALVPASGVSILEATDRARTDQVPEGTVSAAGTIETDGARLCFVTWRVGGDTDALYLPESEYKGCRDAVPGIAERPLSRDGQ